MSVVDLLDDGRGEVVQGLVRAVGVEEVDPLEGGDLDVAARQPITLRENASITKAT